MGPADSSWCLCLGHWHHSGDPGWTEAKLWCVPKPLPGTCTTGEMNLLPPSLLRRPSGYRRNSIGWQKQRAVIV
ncbi:unnamed protein product [Caretta caretta]